MWNLLAEPSKNPILHCLFYHHLQWKVTLNKLHGLDHLFTKIWADKLFWHIIESIEKNLFYISIQYALKLNTRNNLILSFLLPPQKAAIYFYLLIYIFTDLMLHRVGLCRLSIWSYMALKYLKIACFIFFSHSRSSQWSDEKHKIFGVMFWC